MALAQLTAVSSVITRMPFFWAVAIAGQSAVGEPGSVKMTSQPALTSELNCEICSAELPFEFVTCRSPLARPAALYWLGSFFSSARVPCRQPFCSSDSLRQNFQGAFLGVQFAYGLGWSRATFW